jgi:hypothetical protein
MLKYLTNSLLSFAVPSQLKVSKHELRLEDLNKVLDANIYIDRFGQPRSAPLLLGYTLLIEDFLEGPTVPRSKEVRVETSTLFEAHPASSDIPSEDLDLIPISQVLEMAPVDPFELMGRKAKGKKKVAEGGQLKRLRKAAPEVMVAEKSSE